MSVDRTEQLMEAIRENRVLEKLDEMARTQTGTKLIVLLPAVEDVARVHPVSSETGLPDFCRIVQQSEQGRLRCSTCRSLLALNASAHTVAEHVCHGVLSVYAAPAGSTERDRSHFAVVSSCAFRDPKPGRGWPAVKAQLDDLPAKDLTRLRRAYHAIPLITPEKKQLIASIVETAAAEIDHIVAALEAPSGNTSPSDIRAPSDIRHALRFTREALRDEGRPRRGPALVRTVRAIIERNPGSPVTVKNVSLALGMSPNHFSTLFKQHTGESFVDFVTRQRIAYAKILLRDLTLLVGDVARLSGFEQTAYFCRRFKQQTGLTADQWRRQTATPTRD